METTQNKIDYEYAYAIAENTLYGFVLNCLSHYLGLPSAPFHKVLAGKLEDPNIPLLEVIGFRDSAKSTYSTVALILYAAMTGKYKFIVIINDTSDQVKLTIANIRYELENNFYIRYFFGSVILGKTWSDANLLLSNGVRIVGRSRGQNIRGIRHRQYRPDLIVLDDPENLEQTKRKASRDKTTNWFNAEVLPARASFGAKLVVVGNFLHNDGFIARLEKNELFEVLRIPVVDPNTGKPAWEMKYPNKEALDKKRLEVGATAWAREYELKVVAEEDQVIKETDLHYYPNEILTNYNEVGRRAVTILNAGVGVDLAISEKQTADFTAFVGGYKVQWNTDTTGRTNILVLPNPLVKRMDFFATQNEAIKFSQGLPYGTKFYVEDTGYQRAAIQGLKRKGISVFPMRPISDKKARLETVSPFIKDGTVLFPEKGCEDLITSLVNFGVQEHDDDVDALVYMLMGLLNKRKRKGGGKADKM